MTEIKIGRVIGLVVHNHADPKRLCLFLGINASNISDLVQWIVNAGSLQVSSDVIQKSVVLFGVGQARILVVSFNISQQRPARLEERLKMATW